MFFVKPWDAARELIWQYFCQKFLKKTKVCKIAQAVNNFTHFPVLAKMAGEVDASHVLCKEQGFGGNIDALASEFETRFVECRQRKSLFHFTIDPFAFQPDALSDFVGTEQVAEAQLALLELQSDLYLSTSSDVNRKDCLSMWKTISSFQTYNVLCDVAMQVLSMFGSTYRCECAFSAMKSIKSKYRNRITDAHLMHCVRAATTKYVPSFAELVHDKQCHG